MNEQRQPFGVQSDILHILSVIELRLSSLRAKGCKPSDLLVNTWAPQLFSVPPRFP